MPVAWTVLTVEMLKPFLAAAQVDALNTSALGTGQNPRFDDAYPIVAARIRGKVETCVRNILSATANSVPPELAQAAIFLTIQAIQPGLGLPLTPDQVEQIAIAEKDLDKTASCDLAVSGAIDPLNP